MNITRAAMERSLAPALPRTGVSAPSVHSRCGSIGCATKSRPHIGYLGASPGGGTAYGRLVAAVFSSGPALIGSSFGDPLALIDHYRKRR
jgi:hypothetical protein